MSRILKSVFLTLIVLALSVVVFAIAYAGIHCYETKSLGLLKRLDSDMFITLKIAWLDIRLGRYRLPLYAAGCTVVAIIILFVTTFVMTKRNTSDAKFLSLPEMINAGLTKRNGVFIGRAGGNLFNVPGGFTQRGSNKRQLTKPKLIGGKKLWVDGDDVGGFVVGPPRSGKGAALIIPNLLMWPDSCVTLDMRGESYQATAGYRSNFSKVIRFAPADENGQTECYNPLDFISLDRDQRDIDIRNIAAALFPRPASGDTYWVDDGRMLFSGVVSYVMETPRIKDEDRNLRTAIGIMNGVERPFMDWIKKLREQEAPEISDYTLQMLASYADMSDKQFSGLFGSVRTGLAPFMNERLLRATAKSTFDIRNLKHDKVSIYLDFRIEQIRSIGPLFNVLITQLMNFMSKNVPGRGEHRVLLMLDEFQNLGKLENLMEAATILGGYGVPTWFFVQSLKSVDTIYREEGRKTLVNSARVQVFFGAQDGEDLKYISDTLGERSEKQKDVSRTQATMFDMHHARTVHVKEVMRPLMRPDEIRTMSRNKCIILPRGSHAIYGTRNFYFADSELIKRAWKPIPAFKGAPEPVSKKVPQTTAKIRSPENEIIPPLRRFAQQDKEGEKVLRRRGAVFASRTGGTPSIPAAPAHASIGKQKRQTTPTAPPIKLKPINLAALSAAATGNQIDLQKQALVAKFLSQSGKFADQSVDRGKFERASRRIGEAVDDL